LLDPAALKSIELASTNLRNYQLEIMSELFMQMPKFLDRP